MKTFMTGLAVAVVLLRIATAPAAIHHVPADYATIQAAIDASALHDTVLVASGTYFENIVFHGHNIVLASQYLLNHDPATINATIINGSQPVHPDTGSVVRIVSGEDSTAMLTGFTITGGIGTPLADQNSGLVYIEGGGVMVDGASPVIAFNHIVNNQATRLHAGITSAGGGGIRVGFGHPKILNNVIRNNIGRYYGGGIVVNFASAILRNNVICNNTGGQTYGGAGVWMYGSAFPASRVENNTVVNNSTTLNGGGFFIQSTQANLVNNIVWANHSHTGQAQIDRSGAFGSITYCDVQGGIVGNGNIALDPQFADTNLLLEPGSACINTGDSSVIYNDTDGSRNDMGAYGGPGAAPLPAFTTAPVMQLPTLTVDFGPGAPGEQIHSNIPVTDAGTGALRIDSARLVGTSGGTVTIISVPTRIGPFAVDTMRLVWAPTQEAPMNDTLLLYTNDPAFPYPARVALLGRVPQAVGSDNSILPAEFRLEQNYPNPFNPITAIRFTLPVQSSAQLKVYDLLGREVAILLSGSLPAGVHSVTFDASTLPSGIYFYRLEAGSYSSMKKMVLLK